MKKITALIFGGKSSEHEVSVNSAKNIYRKIDRSKYDVFLVGITKQGHWFFIDEATFNSKEAFNTEDLNLKDQCHLVCGKNKALFMGVAGTLKEVDVVFSIVHGTNGEDGTLQGYFKIVNVPFVGCDQLSSAICMDKEHTKIVLNAAGIPNSRYLVIRASDEYTFDQIAAQIGAPFFIKPANAGSSVGVHKIKTAEDYKEKIKDSLQYDYKVLAEEFISGKEVECAVLGLNSTPEASLPGELVVHHEFYSYEAKYLDPNGAETIIPARLNASVTQAVQALAKKAFTALGCDGLGRIDFFVKDNGELYINEVNTLPGFTQISMYPKMWEASGVNYQDLITRLIEFAFLKHQRDARLKTDK